MPLKFPTFKTRELERAIFQLDHDYPRVMVRVVRLLDVRSTMLHVKQLAPLRPFYLRVAKEFDPEIGKWQRENGTMINWRSHRARERTPPHHVTVLPMLPLSVDRMQKMCSGASEFALVREPPDWEMYDRTLSVRYPTSDLCRKVLERIELCTLTPYTRQVAETVGITITPGLRCAEYRALAEAFSATPIKALKATHPLFPFGSGRFKYVRQLIPRIEPEDRTWLPLYNVVRQLPAIGPVRLSEGNHLRHVMRFWRRGLGAMARSGSIGRDATLLYYRLDDLAPDWEGIQDAHDKAQAELTELKRVVTYLEDYRLRPEIQLPGAPALRGFAARSPYVRKL